MKTSRIYELCKQYTDLTDDDIAVLEAMTPKLQELADMHRADVFIDCATRHASSAIVVCEAKPRTIPSSYVQKIVGLLAKQQNEPAVIRSLTFDVRTEGVKAPFVPESANIVQTVEPIHNGDKLIGVLIFEHRASEHISRPASPYQKLDDVSSLSDESDWLTKYIDEAIIMVNTKGIVCFRNVCARDLYARLGYVDDILGMDYKNVLLHIVKNDSGKICDVSENSVMENIEVSLGCHFLRIKQILVNRNDISFALVIQDVTPMKLKEQQLEVQSAELREMHHRIKNNLQTITSILRLQREKAASNETVKVLNDTITRLLSISSTHEILAENGGKTIRIHEILTNLKENILCYFSRPNCPLNILIEGDDFEIHGDIATTIVIIVSELLQNSMKYAFVSSDEGAITVRVTAGELYSTIEVSDNGRGFDASQAREHSIGLSIVRTFVKDRLNGELFIESDSLGTRIRFDFANK